MALKRQDFKGDGLNYYTKSKCPICKEIFEHTKEWAYWRGYVHNKIFLCTWGCARAYDAQQAEKRGYSRTTKCNREART